MSETREEELRLRNTVEALPDGDLLQMLGSPPGDHTPHALQVAREEVSRRGGEDALQQRIAEEEAREWRAAATAETAARPWRRIFYGAVLCGVGIAILATKPSALGEVGRYVVAGTALLLGGFQLLRGIVQVLWVGPTGTYIDPSDPLWQEAVRRARESIPTLRSLAAAHPDDIEVKFSYITDSGEREHLWGRLRALDDSTLRATVETVPLERAARLPDEVTTPVNELLDWHLELPDGTIRGSFTTQAEIAIRKRSGLAAPRRVARLSGKFMDRLDPPPAERGPPC